MSPLPRPRTRSLPLDGARTLVAAYDLAREVAAELTADAGNFDHLLVRVENAVRRCRAAFLAQSHPEADGAIAYHDRAKQDLDSEFVPLYYRQAVLANVLARYERTADRMMQQGQAATA